MQGLGKRVAPCIVAVSMSATGLLACSGEPFTRALGSETLEDSGGPKAAADSDVPVSVIVDGPKKTPDAGRTARPCADGTHRDENGRTEICLSGGTFLMGSNEPNLGNGFADHTPSHAVTVSPFWLDALEVGVGRYAECVEDGACPAPKTSLLEGCTWNARDAELPITCVSWPAAQAFCAWDDGRRLPTEAEWEYAARSGDERTYPWGDNFDCAYAVLASGTACPEYVGELPRRIGSRALGRSETGVLDLSGNVAEWVLDWAGSYRTLVEPDPQGPQGGASRVLRGGSWNSAPFAGYTYARTSAPPQSSGRWGFRCARSAKP